MIEKTLYRFCFHEDWRYPASLCLQLIVPSAALCRGSPATVLLSARPSWWWCARGRVVVAVHHAPDRPCDVLPSRRRLSARPSRLEARHYRGRAALPSTAPRPNRTASPPRGSSGERSWPRCYPRDLMVAARNHRGRVAVTATQFDRAPFSPRDCGAACPGCVAVRAALTAVGRKCRRCSSLAASPSARPHGGGAEMSRLRCRRRPSRPGPTARRPPLAAPARLACCVVVVEPARQRRQASCGHVAVHAARMAVA